MDLNFLEYHNYKIQEKLGSGSYGDVYKALQLPEQQEVAIKVMSRDSHEPNILRRLNHPNIVEYKNTLTMKQTQYLIMEYLNGGTLENFESQNEEEIQDIMIQVFQAINYLHQLGIIHRDIKPANIVRDKNNQIIKLVDFGLSSIIKCSQLQKRCGTFYYMAPEIHLEETYSKSVDMWACGVVMYKLLFGYHPFKQFFTNHNYKDQMKSLKVEIPDGKISTLAKDLIIRLLCPDKVNRYNVKQAIKHPFITKNSQDPIPRTVKEWMNHYASKMKIISRIKSVMFCIYLQQHCSYGQIIHSMKMKTSPRKTSIIYRHSKSPSKPKRRIPSNQKLQNNSVEIKLPQIKTRQRINSYIKSSFQMM